MGTPFLPPLHASHQYWACLLLTPSSVFTLESSLTDPYGIPTPFSTCPSPSSISPFGIPLPSVSLKTSLFHAEAVPGSTSRCCQDCPTPFCQDPHTQTFTQHVLFYPLGAAQRHSENRPYHQPSPSIAWRYGRHRANILKVPMSLRYFYIVT